MMYVFDVKCKRIISKRWPIASGKFVSYSVFLVGSHCTTISRPQPPH